MSDITKYNNEISIPEENTEIQETDITDIISEEEMKNMLINLIGEYDQHKDEAMETFNIFKDMVLNSGDFDSSSAVKEQLAVLLKNAQDATDSKLRIFESLLRTKAKKQMINAKTFNQQNNTYISGNRRELLEIIEKMENESKPEEEEKTQNIEAKIVNNKQEQKEDDFIISAGNIEDEE